MQNRLTLALGMLIIATFLPAGLVGYNYLAAATDEDTVDLWLQEQSDGYYMLYLENHLNEKDTEKKFEEVYKKVNRAASMNPLNPRFKAAHDEGPLLFKHQAINPETKTTITQLGGLRVSAARKDETVRELKMLGFRVGILKPRT
jgi:hypothetical protein